MDRMRPLADDALESTPDLRPAVRPRGSRAWW